MFFNYDNQSNRILYLGDDAIDIDGTTQVEATREFLLSILPDNVGLDEVAEKGLFYKVSGNSYVFEVEELPSEELTFAQEKSIAGADIFNQLENARIDVAGSYATQLQIASFMRKGAMATRYLNDELSASDKTAYETEMQAEIDKTGDTDTVLQHITKQKSFYDKMVAGFSKIDALQKIVYAKLLKATTTDQLKNTTDYLERQLAKVVRDAI